MSGNVYRGALESNPYERWRKSRFGAKLIAYFTRAAPKLLGRKTSATARRRARISLVPLREASPLTKTAAGRRS